MDFYKHTITFIIVWIALIVIKMSVDIYNSTLGFHDAFNQSVDDTNWSFFTALWFAYLATNPDIDLIVYKIVHRTKKRSKNDQKKEK